jgi:hypothetical protein
VQKIKIYLILLGVLLLSGLLSLAFIVNTFAPDKTSNIITFYCIVGVISFSLTTLIGFYLRRLFGQREFLANYATQASRQGIWLAIILIISLILSHNGLFSWINAGLLVLTFIFFEGYLLTRDTNNQDQYLN